MYTHTETDLHIENEYPKLVRDRIPELVKCDGKTADTRTLTDNVEIIKFLLAKLLEESTELVEAEGLDHQKEEQADVYEVLETLGIALGVSRDQIAEVQDSKRLERGGFGGNIVMITKPE